MKNIATILLLFICSQAVLSQDTIRFTGFEGDSTEWKGAGIGEGNITDSLVSMTGDSSSGYLDFPPLQRIASGSRSWQIGSGSDSIYLDSVLVTDFDSVRFRFRFSGTALGEGQGLDGTDSLLVYASVDGEAFDTIPHILITGNANATWGFYGDSVVETYSDTFTHYAATASFSDSATISSTAILHFLPGTGSVRFLFVAINGGDSTFWNIDDIQLEGVIRSPLALRLSSFEVKKKSNGVELTWTTGYEQDGLSYIIERSQDASNFSILKTVTSIQGSEVASIYRFLDLNPGKGWNYYRIKERHEDGTYDYTEVKAVHLLAAQDISIYPTLVQHSLRILTEESAPTHFQISDPQGRVVRSGKLIPDQDWQITGLEGLLPGIYYITFKAPRPKTLRFLKM